MADDGFVLVAPSAGGVRGDETVARGPEWMGGREGFGFEDVEIGGGEAVGFEGLDEGAMVDGAAASDVVKLCAGFHAGEATGVDVVARGFVVGEGVDDVVGLGEGGADAVLRDDVHAGFAAGAAADGEDAHAERREERGEAAGDGAVTEHENGFAVEEARVVAALEILPGAVGELVSMRLEELAPEGEHHGEDVLRAGFGENAGSVGEGAAAGADGIKEVFAIVARITGGDDLDPAEGGKHQALRDIGLAEGDAGPVEERIGFAGIEDGGGARRGKDEAAAKGARTLGEEMCGGIGEFCVAPNDGRFCEMRGHGFQAVSFATMPEVVQVHRCGERCFAG